MDQRVTCLVLGSYSSMGSKSLFGPSQLQGPKAVVLSQERHPQTQCPNSTGGDPSCPWAVVDPRCKTDILSSVGCSFHIVFRWARVNNVFFFACNDLFRSRGRCLSVWPKFTTGVLQGCDVCASAHRHIGSRNNGFSLPHAIEVR